MPNTEAIRQDWSSLVTGERVSVAERGRRPYSATVDLLTQDADVLWIIPDSGSGRKAFDHREGIVIRSRDA